MKGSIRVLLEGVYESRVLLAAEFYSLLCSILIMDFSLLGWQYPRYVVDAELRLMI